MNVELVGAYIRELVDLRGLVLAEVSRTAKVESNYLWRLENGKIKSPSSRHITNLTNAVGGNVNDAAHLLLSVEATIEQAKALARNRFENPDTLTDEQNNFIRRLSPKQLDAVIRLAQTMQP